MKHYKLGTVYLVGAGPGDPGLLTLKGKECVETADVIIYDYLANAEILSFTRRNAERIFVGKHGGNHIMTQKEINRIMIAKASEGKTVVRLKGGDPFIFGRGGEEAEALANAGIATEIVPGVTSAISVPAYAGIPLTHRRYSSSMAIITGHEDIKKKKSSIAWDKLATGVDTIVILMGITNLSFIVRNLVENGRSPDTPAAVIQWGTTPAQRTVTGTLKDIVKKTRTEDIRPPGIIVIGKVVRLRERLTAIYYTSLKAKVLGREVFIAATREGICRITFGGETFTSQRLTNDNENHPSPFPLPLGERGRVRGIRDDGHFAKTLSELRNYFSGVPTDFTSKLDLRGTEFQKMVWKMLLKIPYGKTASYKDIAEMIGHPGAARAVGAACGKNPVPIIVPCHRVINSDGRLGGYSGGLRIKKMLLRLEGLL
ncbi:MAG: uroporphyrinogen-III C-methyltransferase [Nitrospirae bacterium]|nr:uroporphyrinogen-III C-methyltransferase [Nitrospirota bacterium]